LPRGGERNFNKPVGDSKLHRCVRMKNQRKETSDRRGAITPQQGERGRSVPNTGEVNKRVPPPQPIERNRIKKGFKSDEDDIAKANAEGEGDDEMAAAEEEEELEDEDEDEEDEDADEDAAPISDFDDEQ
jgi:hypothetical protein